MALKETVTKITDGGRIVIPAEYRRALELGIGDDVILTIEEREIRIIPRKEALNRAQQIVSRYGGSRSLADELIAQRREEASDE
jgi:AbrB family looped-hinge helix DNA binding protein